MQGALALYSAKTRCEILTSIEFVNHSSYIINFNGKKLITDPWLEYRVFNEGWQLLSSSKMEYDDFRHINYIWFSHEHPDHFMPRVIKNIPEISKSNNLTPSFTGITGFSYSGKSALSKNHV